MNILRTLYNQINIYYPFSMKKILLFLFLPFPFSSFGYFWSECDTKSPFLVEQVSSSKIEIASLYCNFWEPKIEKKWNLNVIKWDFVKYEDDTLVKVSTQELKAFAQTLGKDIKKLRSDDALKGSILNEFIKNHSKHKNKLSLVLKNIIFTQTQKDYIEQEIQRDAFQLFEKTYGERLLMDGQIISREEWGADESYSNPEVYMRGCEDGHCFSSTPLPTTTLKSNYMEHFYKADQANKKTRQFDDGRDPLNYYPVDRIIIHHTAGGYIANKDEALKYMQAVHKYHALTLKRTDIGYHYLIDGEGNIYEGRAGWKYVLGSHVTTHNFGTIGISLMSSGEKYSDAMLESLNKLVVYLGKEYRLDLSQKTIVRNETLSWVSPWWALLAHKELDKRKPIDPDIDMDIMRRKIASEFTHEDSLALKK